VAVILLPKTTSEVLRDSAFDIELAVAAAAQDHHRRRQPGPPP
jgi:hypothetical protein